MTYCLGITTKDGFVVASDSRSNAGYDQVNVCRKMHTFVAPGDRVLVALTSGSLSCSQSIVTLRRPDCDAGGGHAAVGTMYDAARVVGEQVRRVAALDREALERDEYKFNVNVLLAGQIRGQPHDLYLIYPQGNPLRATEDSPFLQIGECKYGRPILDRGVRFDRTTLEDAARYALISLDSTMRSNVTGGPADRPSSSTRPTTSESRAAAGSPSATPTSSPFTSSGSKRSVRPSRRYRPSGSTTRGRPSGLTPARMMYDGLGAAPKVRRSSGGRTTPCRRTSIRRSSTTARWGTCSRSSSGWPTSR